MADWRRSPIVAGVLVLVIAATGYLVYTRVAERGDGEDPLAGESVTLACPHDGEIYRVARKDLGLGPDADADQVQAKARQTPCPKCGKTDSVLAVFCPLCKKPFAPPKGVTKLRDFTCPHCGKKPWARD